MSPSDDGPRTVLPGEAQSPPKAELRRLTGRIGARLREDLQASLESLLEEAGKLRARAGGDPGLRAGADVVEEAAREIAARLSRFESAAAEALSAGTAGDPPAGQTAGEWEPAADAGLRAVTLALRDRLQRTESAYEALRAGTERRERYWRFAIHELRNAAHTFLSWGFVLRRSELRQAPWFAPLLKAADAIVLRAEEALQPGAADMEAGLQLELEPSDLRPVVTGALEAMRPLADLHDLSLALAAPSECHACMALADSRRVEQIMHNLLRNAIEATPGGGAISITLRDEERTVAAEVEDTGPGVPAEIRDALARGAPPPTRESAGRGFGIGLRLSRELAGRMGGSLVVEPRAPGQGACFVLRLPRVRS